VTASSPRPRVLVVALILVGSSIAARSSSAADDDPNAMPAPGAPPPPSAPADGARAPAPAPIGDDEWSRRYVQARASMLAGRFGEAAEQFRSLAAGAREVTQQILAREQADICERWARGGLVLMPAADLPAARARAAGLLEDRRSADELGILYTASVLYGLGTGIALDFWTEPSSAAGGILPALLLGGGAAGLVYALDNPEKLHYGIAQSITSGLWLGLEEGLTWTLWNQARAASADEWSGRTVATTLWASATAGAILGGTLGTAYGTTPGRASLVGSAGLWSALIVGLVGAGAVGASPSADDTYLLMSALGLNAGAVIGAVIGADVSPSIARVRFVDLGALAGGILTGGVYLAISNGHPDRAAMTLTLAAGISGGLVAAWEMTAGMEQDYARGGHGDAPPPASSGGVVPSISPSSRAGRGVDGLVLGVSGGF
jgi:hypothetical protein